MTTINVPVIQGNVILTSPFMATNRVNPHHGADLAPFPRGTMPPILAWDDGEVFFIQHNNRSAGNWIEILHSDNVVTTYMHLDSFAPGLTLGSRVSRGQQIGIMGNTGDSTGVHLHIEFRNVRDRASGRNAVDPMPILLAAANRNKNAANLTSPRKLQTQPTKPMQPPLKQTKTKEAAQCP